MFSVDILPIATSVIAAFIVAVIAAGTMSKLLTMRVRGSQMKNVLKELGIGNFKVSDLDKLTDQGFQRLITLMQAVKWRS